MQPDPIGTAGGMNLYAYVENSPLGASDPYGLYSSQDFLNDAVDWGAGFGDNLTFGITRSVRDQFSIGNVDLCSNFYAGGEWGGIASSFLPGTAGGSLMSGPMSKTMREAGKILVQWSHWIPDRALKRLTRRGRGPYTVNKDYLRFLDNKIGKYFVNSPLNGNYVKTEFHRLTDPFAYKFASKTWKLDNTAYSQIRSQINRVPYWISLPSYSVGSMVLNQYR